MQDKEKQNCSMIVLPGDFWPKLTAYIVQATSQADLLKQRLENNQPTKRGEIMVGKFYYGK